jgi:hypothetical protein
VPDVDRPQVVRECCRAYETGDEVLVTYECTRADGSRFRNTEVMTFDGDKIARTEVYFGWNVERSARVRCTASRASSS